MRQCAPRKFGQTGLAATRVRAVSQVNSGLSCIRGGE
jgi:hypothetical protein